MTKPLFNKIAIVGVGLVGGSLGIDIRKRGLANTVIGFVRHEQTGKKALEKGSIDNYTLDLKQSVDDADLIILSSPIPVIISHLKQIKKFVKARALIIDVGSTKLEIERVAEKYFSKLSPFDSARFVGCHPMAGSEKKGIDFARENLFEKATCYVSTNDQEVINFWRALGAHTIVIDPKKHDVWAAQVSHIPHILAFSLFQGFKRGVYVTPNPSIEAFGRLSKSDANLWSEILVSNSEMVSIGLTILMENLNTWNKALGKKDKKLIRQIIKRANKNTLFLVWKE